MFLALSSPSVSLSSSHPRNVKYYSQSVSHFSLLSSDYDGSRCEETPWLESSRTAYEFNSLPVNVESREPCWAAEGDYSGGEGYHDRNLSHSRSSLLHLGHLEEPS